MIDEDHCVYKKCSGSKFVIITLYVDDILIVGRDLSYVNQIKQWLSFSFEMKDMGETVYILGIKILRDHSKRLLALSQETYINNVLERFHMKDCKPIDTPMAKNEILTKDMCPKTPEQVERMRNVWEPHVRHALYEARYLFCCRNGRQDINPLQAMRTGKRLRGF